MAQTQPPFISLEFIQNALLNTQEDQKCSVLHAGSCNAKAISQFANGCRGVYKMYLLVHLIPLITLKRKRLLKNPILQLKKVLLGFINSLFFAGGYSMLVRRIVCFLTQHRNYNTVNGYIAGLLAGVSLIFQPIGRQSEIALYTLNKSTEVLYNMGVRRNYPIRVPMGECIVTGLALAVIAYVYLWNCQMYRENYRQVIGKLLKDI